MKETLTRKIARQLSDYFKMKNAERTAEAQKNLINLIQTTDKVLHSIPDENETITNIQIDEPKKTKK